MGHRSLRPNRRHDGDLGVNDFDTGHRHDRVNQWDTQSVIGDGSPDIGDPLANDEVHLRRTRDMRFANLSEDLLPKVSTGRGPTCNRTSDDFDQLRFPYVVGARDDFKNRVRKQTLGT